MPPEIRTFALLSSPIFKGKIQAWFSFSPAQQDFPAFCVERQRGLDLNYAGISLGLSIWTQIAGVLGGSLRIERGLWTAVNLQSSRRR